MKDLLTQFGHEVSKDKYLVLILILVLLWSYIHTHNEALLQLLVTAVGGFLGLMRAGTQQQNIASGEGAQVSAPGPKP